MKQTIKYLNDNRKKCVVGINNFMPENCKIVEPCEIVTFDVDVGDDELIFVKTWKHDDKILFQINKKTSWEVKV